MHILLPPRELHTDEELLPNARLRLRREDREDELDRFCVARESSRLEMSRRGIPGGEVPVGVATNLRRQGGQECSGGRRARGIQLRPDHLRGRDGEDKDACDDLRHSCHVPDGERRLTSLDVVRTIR